MPSDRLAEPELKRCIIYVLLLLELTSSPGVVSGLGGGEGAALAGASSATVANLLRLRRRSPPVFMAATPPASSRSPPPSRARLRPADSID